MKKPTAIQQLSVVVVGGLMLNIACSISSPVSLPDLNGTSTATPTPVLSGSSSAVTPTVNSVEADLSATEDATPIFQNAGTGVPPTPPTITPMIDLCLLFTNAQVEPLVGTIDITVTPGSDLDETLGGSITWCTYKGDDVAFVISLAESSPAITSQDWQDLLQQMIEATADNPEISSEAPGIGDQAFWVSTENSAALYVAKYPRVFALAVGGNISPPDDYREGLKTLAEIVLARLP
jgi:hypothetical protein